MNGNVVMAAWLAWFAVTCAFIGYDLRRNQSYLAAMAGGNKHVVNRLAEKLGPMIAVWFPPANVEHLNDRLTWAGKRGLSAEAFLGLKALSAGAAFAVASFLATFGLPVVMAPVMAALFWVVPDAWLSGAVERRQKEVAGQVGSLVSLLVTALRAGIELGPALQEVGSEIPGALGEEMRIAWREMATGHSRASALRSAAKRCGVREFSRFVETIVTAEERGTPDLAGVLASYMSDLRQTARRRAEEEARKIPVKMNAPLIGCIFMPLVIMLITPVLFLMGGGF